MQTDRQTRPITRTTEYDVGLRRHLSSVYNRMTAGVLVTAVVAWIVSSSPALLQLFLGGPQAYVVMFGPLAVIWFAFKPETMSSQKLMWAFIGVSVLYGISFSTIALAYAKADIARALFISSAAFAGVSVFGYTTKRDLGPIAVFLFMAMIGLILVGVTGLFIEYSHAMEMGISAISVVVFAGLTAWQTQEMKRMYNSAHGAEINSRMAWAAALNLYVSFVAMFINILHLTSNR